VNGSLVSREYAARLCPIIEEEIVMLISTAPTVGQNGSTLMVSVSGTAVTVE